MNLPSLSKTFNKLPPTPLLKTDDSKRIKNDKGEKSKSFLVGVGQVLISIDKKTRRIESENELIPTDRQPLDGEVSANFPADRGCRVVCATDPQAVFSDF
jgi:hypothetical protein